MIYYKSGYKHQLHCDYVLYVDFLKGYQIEKKFFAIDDGFLVIRAGFCWDGASGPTWDTKSVKRASLVHDVLCQCMAYDLLPKDLWVPSNELLYDIMIEGGAWKWRARFWLKGLNWFGKPEQKKVETA